MKARLPNMKEAVEIITMQFSRSEQIRQLRFLAETQGDAFAGQVKAKVLDAKGFKKS